METNIINEDHRSIAMQRAYAKAALLTSMAYVLADVMDSYIMETESNLALLKKGFSKNEKHEFKKVQQEAKNLQRRVKMLAKPIYEIKDTDNAVMDSDYFADLFLLIVDRVGEDKNKMLQLRATINNTFPSFSKVEKLFPRIIS